MELRYLKEFVILADIGNYTAAAKKLDVSQSVLSKHMKSVENELGIVLFIRNKQGIALSEAGALFLPYAQKIVKMQGNYERMLSAEKDEKKTLGIASIPGMTQMGITDLLSSFVRNHRDVRLKIMEDSTNRCIASLRSGESEVAFVEQVSSRYPELIYIPYRKNRILAYLPLDHQLAEKSELSLKDLENEKLIFPEENGYAFRFLYEACENAGFEPAVVTTNNNLRHSIMMVSKNVGIALLSEMMCRNYFKKTVGICSRNFVPELHTVVYCCYDPEKISPTAERFVREVVAKSDKAT